MAPSDRWGSGAFVREPSSSHQGGRGRRVMRSSALVLLPFICLASAGAWWGLHRDQLHEARAEVLVAPLVGNPFSPEAGGDDLVKLTTEAELVTSDAVAQLAASRLPGRPSVAQVLAGVKVKVPPNTQVLAIVVSDRSAEGAKLRAQTLATTFLNYRTARMQSAVFDRSARVKELIAQRTKEMRADIDTLGRLTSSSAQAIQLRQQVLDLTSQISALRTQLAGLESTARDPGQVVTPAALKTSLLGSPALLGIVGGSAAGLLAGVVLVAVRRRVDDRVTTPADLAPAGLAVLGPARPDNAEDSRRMRTGLLAAVEQRPMVVMIAAAAATPVRVRCADGLAGSLGSAGLEVIVVDAAGDRGETWPPSHLGFSDLITGASGVDDALAGTAPHVSRLGVGHLPGVLDDLVDSPETEVLVEELRKRADVVLIVAGPAGSTRARSLVRLADAAFLEVLEGRTRLADLRDGVDQLTQAGGQVRGAIYIRAEHVAARDGDRGRKLTAS